jgi:hypothetical protein
MWTDVVWGALTAGMVLLLGTGAVLEVRALLSRRQGDTYSEWLRPQAKRHPGLLLAVVGVLLGLLAWLPEHILG